MSKPQSSDKLNDKIIIFFLPRFGNDIEKNGLDKAIDELKNSGYETYVNFDDFMNEAEHES